MTLIDISPRLEMGIAGWPGDTPCRIERTLTIGPGVPVNVSRIVLSSHVGAHADAPLHVDPEGAAIEQMQLEPFLGPCHLVDASAVAGPLIEPGDVLPRLPARLERVLIRQYKEHPRAWDPDLKGLAPRLIEALAARGVRLVGVDAASVDPATSKTMDAHHALLAHGIAILEGLVLASVPAGAHELIALPLAITGCDGAPVRAVLRTLEDRPPSEGASP